MAESWMGGAIVGCTRILWRVSPFAILWSIWKEMNDRIIRGSSSSSIDLIPRVALRIAKWALVRKKFSNVHLNDILENWEACMGCGLPR